jgi:hypothetical protein
MTYFIVCITKFPTHHDPRHRITELGTSTAQGSRTVTRRWAARDVVAAIDSRADAFWCTDRRGDLVKVVTVPHAGGKYLKTENDGIEQDNLLAQPSCG